ncbi:thermonuclease family protein [Fuscibacter oryzae]|uniref:Thermonuclease family protein n=1 Tax=Fuscibacter oryzae TaxID=2803939 RepID=A0A8J7MLY8_9RHOB|nr:thermonuclease family protein [Fuscibacter oryzae]MBL4927240.1 thermonuclease family protein [Fuscibacter oryzae]
MTPRRTFRPTRLARRTSPPGMRAIGWLAGVLALWLVALPFAVDGAISVLRPATSETGSCRILRVVDGDTVNLWCARGGHVKARLLGYDSPEVFSPRCLSEFLRAQHATWFLRWSLLTGKALHVILHDRDRYGRRLVELTVDGQPVAKTMIDRGLGRGYQGGQRQGWCD